MSKIPPKPPATPLGAIRKYHLFLTEDGSIATTVYPVTKDAERIIREQSGEIAELLREMEQQGRPLKSIPGTNQLIDSLIRAKPAGWRRSAAGNWYYEDRENRSDTDAERGAFRGAEKKEPQEIRQKRLAKQVDPNYPYFKKTDWICDGFHKDGQTRPPKRCMCLSSGTVVLDGWTGEFCRLRGKCEDTHCIWHDINAAPEPKQEPAPVPNPAPAINEDLARRAQNAYSWSDYKPGSATAEYDAELADLQERIEEHKKKVDPIYYDKIDAAFERYARKLADWTNRHNSNTASYPSWFIAGSSNYNTRRHDKQMARESKLWEEYDEIKKIPDRILRIGTSGAISATDKDAAVKLQKRISALEAEQERMKRANAYYRKHKTMEGCPDLTAEEIADILRSMEVCSWQDVPYESFHLSNNNQNIHRLKQRLAQLEKTKGIATEMKFDGGTLKLEGEDQRVRIYFDEKPDVETRTALKKNGFKWSPKAGAWQRVLTNIAVRAAKDVLGIE
ncbi:MAG: hypothetical protein Q4Q04_05095 [Methanocorpusculum sp.]|nr:hypothetical protein [Methanocorpusculum sp.]